MSDPMNVDAAGDDDSTSSKSCRISAEEFASFLRGLNKRYWAENYALRDEHIHDLFHQQFKEQLEIFHEVSPSTDLGKRDVWTSNVASWRSVKVTRNQRNALAEEIVKFLDSASSSSSQQGSEREGVDITHRIKDTVLTHTFDLRKLCGRVDDTFEKFYSQNPSAEDRYCGPYFVFVQSSGMGKTKLLYECSKQYRSSESTDVKMVLCREKRKEAEGDVFDCFLNLVNRRNESFKTNMEEAEKKLEDLVSSITAEKAVLLFDEAHYLLKDGFYENESNKTTKMSAFLFRLVRLWLCKKRSMSNLQQIIAIFTGTTAKLKNFIIQDDLEPQLETDTREASTTGQYHPRGRKTFPPFFTTTTIGCLRMQDSEFVAAGEDVSEHTAAIPYGRPLFAVMTPSEYWGFLPTVLKRMVLSLEWGNEWKENREACLNILSTRVQMGQTTFDIASRLVSSAYANLVGFQPDLLRRPRDSVSICYMPDPVCARLAMGLMDKKWCMDADGVRVEGEAKTFWVGKMKELYTSQICTPEKGDLGEVMVALYFLFCADTLRGEADDEYNTFSVSLGDWIDLLLSGGTVTDGNRK